MKDNMELDKSINNDFEQTLIDNGYKWFSDNWKHSMRGIQKKIKDKKGIKYFITGYHYNLHKQYHDRTTGDDDYDRYSFRVQFRRYKDGKDQTIDVSFSADFVPNKYRPLSTLEEIETFFEKIWKYFKFDYYDLNEN